MSNQSIPPDQVKFENFIKSLHQHHEGAGPLIYEKGYVSYTTVSSKGVKGIAKIYFTTKFALSPRHWFIYVICFIQFH